ncbi:MAG: ABC transporter substrate-binding protein [Actinomycetes bacterium]
MLIRKLVAVAGAATLAVGLASCAASQRTTPSAAPGTSGAAAASDATFIFGAAGAPKLFDPSYASDGETFRITRQIYEELLAFEPGTAKVAPGLATEWTSSEDGLTWDFTIRPNVTFHDGTALDAAAVCANFERWYNLKGPAQSTAVAYYWANNWGGFNGDGKDTLYGGCTATEPMTATIKLTRYTSKFPAILAHNAYSIHSPSAMEQYDASNVVAQGSGFVYPEYALKHPTGTGPFTFGGYDDAKGEVTLNRNEDYWGEKAGVAKMVVRTIPDESTRRQELQAGTIHGYDLPNPVDWKALEDGGNEVAIRPAFNVLYVGLNATKNEALKDLRVRQALSYAINREQLVRSQLPEGAEPASQFFPKAVSGYNTSLQPYPHDPEKAKALLADAGHANLEIEFWQPTEVTRPYMPDPAAIYEAIRSDWEAVGVKVTPVSKPWNGGYLDGTNKSEAPAFLLGWTGDYDSADNFIGTFFTKQDNQFATQNYPFAAELTAALVAADSEPDPAKREQMVSELNRKIAEEYVPSLPISHSPPALVVSSKVKGLVPSPLAAEDFSKVTIEG